MFKLLVVLLLIFVSQGDAKCEEQGTFMKCDSVYDVRKWKQQQNWTVIHIVSEEKYRISEYFFAKTPNVTKIHFENAVKEIEEFTFFDLSSLKYLTFVDCDLPIIKKHWFSDLFSIQQLTIENSNVKSLEPGCFEGTPNLTKVIIKGNNISHIPGNIFSGTTIEYLNLKNNKIQFIQDNAFINMSGLVILYLNKNLLKSFIPKAIIGDSGLSNLQELNLMSNEIEIIPSGTFNGLINLELLDVSCNKLESFPESAFPYSGLPSLYYLLLGNNRINYLPRSFIKYFPKLGYIDIFGNPWQCVCYKDIINSIVHNKVRILSDEEYLNGRRPVCVVPETGSDKCLNNIQISNDLYDSFAQDIINPCEYY